MILSDIKEILDYYSSQRHFLRKIFFKEDMPIIYIRKYYELLSMYRHQDEVLNWDQDRLINLFGIVCSTAIVKRYKVLYEALGQFQRLLGLCDNGVPHYYKLEILFNTPWDTHHHWKMLYQQRANLKEIASALNHFVVFFASQNPAYLNDFYFNRLCLAGEHAASLAKGVTQLATGQCLTANNFSILYRHKQHAESLGSIIAILSLRHLLTPALLTLVNHHASDAANLLFFINRVSHEALSFNNIQFIYTYPSIFAHQEVYELLARLPNAMTAAQFQALREVIPGMPDIAVAVTQIGALMQQWLPGAARIQGATPARQQRINYRQSVHNKAVELSALASLKRLKASYPRALNKNIEENLQAMGQFIARLDIIDPKHQLAKKAFDRFKISRSAKNYRLEAVNFPTLLSLLWEAMHDKNKLTKDTTPNVMRERLIYALCETEQESINDDAQDQDGYDFNTCIGGSFTKLIDTLNRVHVDVEIQYATLEVAGFRLQGLIKEMVRSRLHHANTHQPETLPALLIGLQQEGANFILDDMRKALAEKLVAEFRSLFQSTESAGLQEIINTARDVDIEGILRDFQDKTDASITTQVTTLDAAATRVTCKA
jgi:hypothetical protein